ncbi:regulatory protein RecX [Anaeromyxobacter oryzisoli]|uniref:regulatory protein RecX n=1 Tax=Anaeromyxobacter oryzisoli TaxID=2925408 RepID=UPI001F560489|nr:regulatory protein RecX [Anaeromyxobacter sp. SG63]
MALKRGPRSQPSGLDPLARAKAIALRQLAARMRTEAQLRARLAKDGLEGEADAVVAWLAALGYLDDGAYARARARGLVARGAGPRLVERRLVSEGIDAAAARAAAAEALAGEVGEGGRAAELAQCRALAARRARGIPLEDLDDRGRRRLARFLLGRGFAGSVVSRVLGIHADG